MLSVLLFAACGSSKSPEPATPAPTEAPSGEAPAMADRPSLSAADCEAQGGQVVGDIGDGAVHRPDYVCASGGPPMAKIAAEQGGAMAVEGSVCCKK